MLVDIPLLSGLRQRRYGLPPASIEAATSREGRIFASHLYDPVVRGRRHDWADAEPANILDDLYEVITSLQDAVVRDLRASGIVIEANPTSNLATGAVGSMEEHPLLRHLRNDHDAGLFSINTDDPGVFATRCSGCASYLHRSWRCCRRFESGRAHQSCSFRLKPPPF
ncbi:adenosine deaminase [Azospirillum lipoferum]|uniref:Adenosine deaminase n=1 Tax=Azospirillum lipoferum (strain 4B) TaxID=862719 RepID=G7Z4G5_AZOL4|nr:adenosine deaminase [Azospirillum lipoferum]CBS86283.1 putative adenosine deaminase [Azospirillum lipoferum 4B]